VVQPAVVGDSVKSRTPAEMLSRGPRPGVERSGTPGNRRLKRFIARGSGRQPMWYVIRGAIQLFIAIGLSPATAGSPSYRIGSWGSAALHPRAGSPAEHLGWGARLYAVARYRGLGRINYAHACLRQYQPSD
jgi:hypothetical protein